MKSTLKIEMYPVTEFFQQLPLRRLLADRPALDSDGADIEQCVVFCHEPHKYQVYVLGQLRTCPKTGYEVDWFNFHPGRKELCKTHTFRYRYPCFSPQCYDEIKKDAYRTVHSLLQLHKLLD